VSIKFHCNHCSKQIKAPDEAGGKHGKCPYCKQEVYVPMPDDQLEEIPIAPLDEQADQLAKELADEDRRLRGAAAREEDGPPGKRRRAYSSDDSGPLRLAGEKPDLPPSAAAAGEITGLIVKFVLAMQESKLEEADHVAAQLQGAASRAKDEVQRLMVDEIPPSGLENLPPALYKGFLKSLLDRL
jgi:hypothetical protein